MDHLATVDSLDLRESLDLLDPLESVVQQDPQAHGVKQEMPVQEVELVLLVPQAHLAQEGQEGNGESLEPQEKQVRS